MTVTGEVIKTFYNPTTHLLVNVRAIDIGWQVSVIDTRNDRIIRYMQFGSRAKAEQYAEDVSKQIEARQVLAHSYGPRPDPQPRPSTLRYWRE